ncbi:hypothetical protein VL762_11760 [Flavobacterium psychrophilum]|uniref:hypothetical protein n=1 Tax=Flavobacterium psychrophilum TaxID=96345 RepID=UPI002C2558DB|nr:hypothetical protein [Flavobacterium psychrophilum]
MNFSQSTEKPFYKKKIFLIIAGLVIITMISKNCKSDDKTEVKEKVAVEKPKFLKVINSIVEKPYTKPGYENIRTYYYGVYLNYPKDTTGIKEEVMDLLKEKTELAEENEAVHLWIFTDSTLIPKSYDGEWGTAKMRKKCFGHAVKLTNGNYSYDYDIFGEFKP